MFQVRSVDGVDVSVHDFGGPPSSVPILISHATGFHAHCYEPVARHLATRHHVLALDHRGHGSTPAPPGEVTWAPFGRDTAAVVDAIASDGRLVGVGHSMGGATLLMVAAATPARFERLVLFEPIAIPPDDSPGDGETIVMDEHPIVVGARRRRRHFGSAAEAIENFAVKPPLSVMTPEVLAAYVHHGFRPVADGIELACDPEFEAGIFVSSRGNGVWDLLPDVHVPVTVVSGAVDERQPSGRCAAIADRLPDAELIVWPHQSHLGPFSHPAEFAELILERTA